MARRLHESGMLLVSGLDELRLGDDQWHYVATPFTRYIDGLETAYLLARDISDSLDRADIKHFCPIVSGYEICIRSGIESVDHQFWMSVYRPFMERANDLVVIGMDGWDQSLGIISERSYFGAAAKPIYFLDPAIILAAE